jgi:hypothetical protein
MLKITITMQIRSVPSCGGQLPEVFFVLCFFRDGVVHVLSVCVYFSHKEGSWCLALEYQR